MTRNVLLAIPFLVLAACDGPGAVEPDATMLQPDARSSSHDAGAQVWWDVVEAYPFGPAPLAAPCLDGVADLDNLVIQGTWAVRAQNVLKPGTRYHLNEHLDYSNTEVTDGTLTWVPAPGATEKIVWHVTVNGPQNFIHEFHGRYLSQDGLADLRVDHHVHRTWGPDGTTLHVDIQGFSADCLGG